MNKNDNNGNWNELKQILVNQVAIMLGIGAIIADEHDADVIITMDKASEMTKKVLGLEIPNENRNS